MKQTALTKEQTNNLLQQLKGLEENFEEAQKAKTYFKNRYRNAVREIHDLRLEDHRQIQDYIKVQKQQLSTMNLNAVLNADESYNFPGRRFTKSENNFDSFKWCDLDFAKPSSSTFT